VLADLEGAIVVFVVCCYRKKEKKEKKDKKGEAVGRNRAAQVRGTWRLCAIIVCSVAAAVSVLGSFLEALCSRSFLPFAIVVFV
jgi:hypothetical protein